MGQNTPVNASALSANGSHLATGPSQRYQTSSEKAANAVERDQPPSGKVRERFWNALLEGERKDYEPFDEYLELLLHFLWTASFATVWPIGTVWSLMNQLLEYRFDCLKLLASRRRRFPNTRHMSVVWVPFFVRITCYVSMAVNTALLLMPYRQLSFWFPHTIPRDRPLMHSQKWPWLVGVSLIVFATLVIFRQIATSILGVVLWRTGSQPRSDMRRSRASNAPACLSHSPRPADILQQEAQMAKVPAPLPLHVPVPVSAPPVLPAERGDRMSVEPSPALATSTTAGQSPSDVNALPHSPSETNASTAQNGPTRYCTSDSDLLVKQ